MGGIAFSSDEAMRRRKVARDNNYQLNHLLQNDLLLTDGEILYLSVNDSAPYLESFLGFLVRYHYNSLMLHSLIVRQTKYIIQILQLLTDYDVKLANIKQSESVFYCRSSYSTKWILSNHTSNSKLTYEHAKKILNIWNDGSTQTLMLLIEKNENENGFKNKNEHYYNYIKPYLLREYPIDCQFCKHFISNVLKFRLLEMTISNHFERKLFLKCLTNNGKFSLLKQTLDVRGYQLRSCCFEYTVYTLLFNCNLTIIITIMYVHTL